MAKKKAAKKKTKKKPVKKEITLSINATFDKAVMATFNKIPK